MEAYEKIVSSFQKNEINEMELNRRIAEVFFSLDIENIDDSLDHLLSSYSLYLF